MTSLASIRLAAETIQDYVRAWSAENQGRIVATPAGKYKGRPGRVDGACFDLIGRRGREPDLCVLVMTLRADGSDVLNSHGDTRTYWPISMIPELAQ